MTKLAKKSDGIPIVANSTQRDSLFPSPDTHQRVQNLETGYIERYDGSGWAPEIPLGTAGVYRNLASVVKGSTGDVTDAVNDTIGEISTLGGGVLDVPWRSGGYSVTQIIPQSGVTIRGVPDKRQFYYYAQFLQSAAVDEPMLFSDYPVDTSDPSNRVIAFNLENIGLKAQNASATAAVVQLRYGMKSSWKNVYVQAASTASTVVELADWWDSTYEVLHCQEGGWSLRIVNRGDIDNCNNLIFYHPHLESGRLGCVDNQGGAAAGTKNTKIEFYAPKFEAHPSASGVSNIRFARTRGFKVFGGFSATASGAPPSSYPMIDVAGDNVGAIFAGHALENDGLQIGSYVKFSQSIVAASNSGIKMDLEIANTTNSPTNKLLHFQAGTLTNSDINLYSLSDPTSSAYVGTVGATLDSSVAVRVLGKWLTQPLATSDGVLTTEPGYRVTKSGCTDTWYMGRGQTVSTKHTFRLLHDAVAIFEATDDDRWNWKKDVTMSAGANSTVGDTTPDVYGFNLIRLTSASARTITAFDGAFDGFELTLTFADANTTIQHNANIRLAGGVDFVSSSNDVLTLVKSNSVWMEKARSVNG